MAKRVSGPTYESFIVGELKRFDESNHVYSRVDRGEVIPPEMIPKGDSSKSAGVGILRLTMPADGQGERLTTWRVKISMDVRSNQTPAV
jgi:hypothetical protein